jgi:MFS family permease
MPSTFRRSHHTWLLYLVYAVYGYVLNSLGPAMPFLKSELKLTYTVASLHFSAFAVGMIFAGLGGNLVVARKGRKWVLWFALFGMCLSVLGLFITGLGVASLYPIAMALALGAADLHTVQAGTRAGLASGIAIFTLPLVLGRLADALGIQQAYGVIVVLLIAAFALIQLTERTARRVILPG